MNMQQEYNKTTAQETDDFLDVTFIKEDWGGDGTGRLNLSGRSTAITQEYVPREYQFFHINVAEEQEWQIDGMPKSVTSAKRRLLTWHNSGASTSIVYLPPQFEAPAGIFTADLEIFILKGTIQIGDWQLNKHGYSFIPAGVRLGSVKVIGGEEVEILWMENGPVPLKYENLQDNHSSARLNEYIPALDSKLLPWGKTDTVQFEVAKKKYLRKHSNGGGTWLLAVLPHYDGINSMIQSYNEEAYCISGYCDIGDYHVTKGSMCYCPSFVISGRHVTDDGGLFFVRVDRDLSRLGTVLSYRNYI